MTDESVPEGCALVPREVLEFYQFAEIVFVPFTPQQEELKISLDKAKAAMRAGAVTSSVAAAFDAAAAEVERDDSQHFGYIADHQAIAAWLRAKAADHRK